MNVFLGALTEEQIKERFPDEKSCKAFLEEKKWGKQYICPKCGHTRYCAANKPEDRQCTSCRYIASPTSGTLFHKVKFPLEKAFLMTYHVLQNPNVTSTSLSETMGLRQKTCWYFKKKVLAAKKVHGDDFVMQGAAG